MISANLPFAENVLLNPTLLKLWSTVAHDLFCRYPATNTQKDILREMLHSKNARGVDDTVLRLCPSGTLFIIIILTHICDSNKSSVACLRGRGHYWKVENMTNMLFRGAQKVKFFLHFILNCWWQSLILYRVESTCRTLIPKSSESHAIHQHKGIFKNIKYIILLVKVRNIFA